MRSSSLWLTVVFSCAAGDGAFCLEGVQVRHRSNVQRARLRHVAERSGLLRGTGIITAGQVLSGAREEASVAGAAPIQLFDGLGVARLCEDHDVAVLRARLPVAIPDVDLLEALRAS